MAREESERLQVKGKLPCLSCCYRERARSACGLTLPHCDHTLTPSAFVEHDLLSLDLRSSRDLAELAGTSPSLPVRPSVPRLRERLGKDISGRFARYWLCTCLPLGELLLLLPAIDHEWCCVLC